MGMPILLLFPPAGVKKPFRDDVFDPVQVGFLGITIE